jgi:WS/DGAT/MGAT family acyltransferase
MQRMSGLDASFLYLETPNMPMHVGLVCVLDPGKEPYDFSRVCALIESEARGQESLRRRLVEVPFGLSHPLWVDDPQFDIIHHVRRVSCHPPGGEAELCDVVGRIMSSQLDRSRPLWEAWIIEGLALGRFALVVKVHHAIADGLGGAQLLQTMFSPSPEPRPLSVPPPGGFVAPPVPNEVELLRDALSAKLDAPKQLVQLFRRTTNALGDFYERRTHDDHHAGATMFDAPNTRWNQPITNERIVAFARIAQDDLRTIRKAFGATPNEIVLALCAGALRGFLQERGELPLTPLVAGCPVAVRSRVLGKPGGNRISALVTSLATDIDDPLVRLQAIRTTARGAKAEHDQLGGDMLASWADMMFPGMFRAAAKLYSKYRVAARHRPIYNVTISNVPGPRKPLYFGGARLVGSYPLGPVAEGMGLNITVFSYGPDVDFGLVAARTLLPDVAEIAARIGDATDELVQLALKAETPAIAEKARLAPAR